MLVPPWKEGGWKLFELIYAKCIVGVGNVCRVFSEESASAVETIVVSVTNAKFLGGANSGSDE